LISAHPDALLPLEFLYEREAPLADAALCPRSREALGGSQVSLDLTDPLVLAAVAFLIGSQPRPTWRFLQ